jgi:Zn-dependent protease with chaperone function
MIHDADTVRLQPGAIEYALLYTHPGAVERIATAMQWRAASRRDAPP